MNSRIRILGTTVSLILALSANAAAQSGSAGSNPAQLHASRAELQALLAGYDQSAKSSGYSQRLRDRARYEAALIRQRLDEGDFQVGDRIALIVEAEPTLSDTLVVTSGITAVLPTGDTLSLRKVLRSELQDKLQQAMARVVKQPTVHTETFLRIGILGAVGQQGFYELRSDALLTDVLNKVGIPGTAVLTDMKVERSKKTIWDGEPLQQALSEGRTLDQLSLRTGDVISIPSQGPGKGSILRTARSALMIVPVFYALKRVFHF